MTDRPSDDNEIDDQAKLSQISYSLGGEELPSEGIVRTVATLTETPPLDLEPLYDVIDPVHIDELFADTTQTTVQGELSFTFNGCQVTVTPDEVQACLIEDSS